MSPHHIRSYVQRMSETQASTGDYPGAGQYEIRLKGHLASRWSAWFDGLTLTRESDGHTLIEGPVVDQAALHGLLQKVRDTGLPLVSVRYSETDPSDASIVDPR